VSFFETLPHRKKAGRVIAEFLMVFCKILFVEKEMEQEWII
jgi:hypothetical protein